jgi:hypothetical protein
MKKNPTTGGLSLRTKHGRVRRSLRTWTALAMFLFMVFAIGVSALQNAGQSNGQQTGSRTAGVKPKRTSAQRRDKKSKDLKASASLALDALSPVLATADFDLLGLAVTVDPASLTVPKNTATSIHTSVRVPEGTDPLNIIAALNPNYRVRGELTGPSLTSPLTLEAPDWPTTEHTGAQQCRRPPGPQLTSG